MNGNEAEPVRIDRSQVSTGQKSPVGWVKGHTSDLQIVSSTKLHLLHSGFDIPNADQ